MLNSDFVKASTDAKVREFADDLAGLKSLILQGREITNASLECIAANCFELRELSLSDTSTTDDGLRYIGKLPSLNWLSVDSDKATDLGLGRIITLPSLKGLHLIDAQISDDGLASLKTLKESAYLEVVTRNDIGAEGLRSITDFAGLEYLRLSAPKITEEKFSLLVLCNSLRSFTFEMPLVGEVSANELNKKYPACHFERYRFQRSEYQESYETAMKQAIERSPVPTSQAYTEWRMNKTANDANRRRILNPPDLRQEKDIYATYVTASNVLTAQEVDMLIARGLLDPNFKNWTAIPRIRRR